MYLPCTWVRNLSQVGAQAAAADRGAETGRREPQKGCPPALTWRGPTGSYKSWKVRAWLSHPRAYRSDSHS
jgi:hypothetical protein